MNENTPSSEEPTPTPEANSPAPAETAPTGSLSNDEKNMAMLAHLLGILISFIGALIIWLLKKDSSSFIDHHGKQALNFQITMMIGYLVGSVTTVIFIGCFILVIVFVVNIIFCIIAAMAASKGEMYRYPIAIPLLK